MDAARHTRWLQVGSVTRYLLLGGHPPTPRSARYYHCHYYYYCYCSFLLVRLGTCDGCSPPPPPACTPPRKMVAERVIVIL